MEENSYEVCHKNNTDRDMPDHYVYLFGGCGRKKQVTAQKAGVLKPEAPGRSFGSCGEAVVDIYRMWLKAKVARYKGSAKKISVEVIGKNNSI